MCECLLPLRRMVWYCEFGKILIDKEEAGMLSKTLKSIYILGFV